jgi:hypothetical protein
MRKGQSPGGRTVRVWLTLGSWTVDPHGITSAFPDGDLEVDLEAPPGARPTRRRAVLDPSGHAGVGARLELLADLDCGSTSL